MTAKTLPSAWVQRQEQHRREVAAAVRRGMIDRPRARAKAAVIAQAREAADIITLRRHGDALRIAMMLEASVIAARRRSAAA